MSQEVLAKGIQELQERIEAENQSNSAQEIILDSSNKVKFPGYPYIFEAVGETILISIDVFKSGYECKICKGKKEIETKQGRESVFVPCEACRGIGYLLVLPDSSKNLPTTGVVVSMGGDCKPEELGYKVGDRVLFGPYAGNMIPTKAGLMFKYMDAKQVKLRIEGGDELSAFDFIINEDE